MVQKSFYQRTGFRTAFGLLLFLAAYVWAYQATAANSPILNLLVDLGLFILSLFLMISLTSQFVLPVVGWDQRIAVVTRLIEYLMGTRGPVMFVENGEAVEAQGERKRSGSGVLLIGPTSGAVLRTNTRFTRSIGPGLYFTAPGERLAEPIDLRRQVRSIKGSTPETGEPMESGDLNPQAMTQDGIPISADISVSFIHDPGHDGLPREGRHAQWPPYEFNAHAAEKAVYGHAYRNGDDVPWTELPLRMAVDIWRERVKRWPLESLLRTDADQPAPLQVIRAEITERLTPPEADEQTTDMDFPESDLDDEFQLLHARGIRILGAGVSNLYLPLAISEERVLRWHDTWSAAVDEALSEAETMIHEVRLRAERAAYKQLAVKMTVQLRDQLTQGKLLNQRDTLALLLLDLIRYCEEEESSVPEGKAIAAQMRIILDELSTQDGDCRRFVPDGAPS